MPRRPASRSSRRGFLAASSAVASGYWIATRATGDEPQPGGANEEIRFACIGIGGKGKSDSSDAARSGRVVAVADVDANQLRRAERDFPGAKAYDDFRRLFAEMGREFDAVTISTPDHTHITAASLALGMGKHCYCQKPLTRAISEARTLGDLARANKVATQMGNQGTAESSLRRTAAFLAGGGIGTVKELHVWTNRPVWPQGGNRPAAAAVPPHISWDLWLGPAPLRPYAAGYHPFAWRGFWDFGSGALGDMACHTFNMPFMALDLRDPATVQATTSGHNGDSYPKWSIIDFAFPARGGRPALTVRWYDGGKLPDQGLFAGFRGEIRTSSRPKESGAGADIVEEELPFKAASSGVLAVGDKDVLYAPGDYAEKGFILKSGAKPADVACEESPGHFAELVRAIRGGPPPRSNFPDYGGPLTETILLGNLAVWAADLPETPGKRIEWDPAKLVATNAPEVETIIRPLVRPGWKA